MKKRTSRRPSPPSRPVRVVVEPALHDDPDSKARALAVLAALLDADRDGTGAGR